jgi:hypothetical protein
LDILGDVIVQTRGVAEACEEHEQLQQEIVNALMQFQARQWGVVDVDDAQLNNEAVMYGGRILAAYATCAGVIWIISEADRSATTILFPDEY